MSDADVDPRGGDGSMSAAGDGRGSLGSLAGEDSSDEDADSDGGGGGGAGGDAFAETAMPAVTEEEAVEDDDDHEKEL